MDDDAKINPTGCLLEGIGLFSVLISLIGCMFAIVFLDGESMGSLIGFMLKVGFIGGCIFGLGIIIQLLR